MKLEVGKTYRDRIGGKHKVMGIIKDLRPGNEWVWTLGGLWFVLETGQSVGIAGALPLEDPRTLIDELPPEESF